MHQAIRRMSFLFSKVQHLTCPAHALHGAAEEIRSYYSKIDQLFSAGEKTLIKAPSRIASFQEVSDGIRLPPQALVTRWRWGGGARSKQRSTTPSIAVKETVASLGPSYTALIRSLQGLFQEETLPCDLIYVTPHFRQPPRCIQQVDGNGLPFSESPKLIEDTRAPWGACRR